MAVPVALGSAVGLTVIRGVLAAAFGELNLAEAPGGETAVALADVVDLAPTPLALDL